MKKIFVIFGTRPDAIKMIPVIKQLELQDNLKTVVIVTGQHREMLHSVLKSFEVYPDYDLDIMLDGQSLFNITEKVMEGLQELIRDISPDALIVHGDTTSAFAAALTGFYMRIPVYHVEAGLRTYNISAPYPEEFNRRAIDVLSDICFAPTETAKSNLICEGVREDQIFVTGNTGLDCLKFTIKEDFSSEILDWVGTDKLVLLTAHRRETQGTRMKEMFIAIRDVVREMGDIKLVYPVHKNPNVINAAQEVFEKEERVLLTEPQDVVSFHNLMNKAYLIITDSGGIQEEATFLGKPTIVLRDTTERPEGISAGNIVLSGTSPDNIKKTMRELLFDDVMYEKMAHNSTVFGDGKASLRIINVIGGKHF